MQRATRSFSSVAVMAVLVSGLLMAGSLRADPGGGDDEAEPSIEKARDAIDDGSYRRAVKHLKKHLENNERDADALNLMGFSLRNMKRYDESEDYYLKALEIDPDHLGANEYLGELYLQTDRPDLARERLAVLRDACPDDCPEYRHLDEAFDNYGDGEGP